MHHCPGGSCHEHFLQHFDATASGSFVVPDHGDDVYLELSSPPPTRLGLTDVDSVSIHPQTVTLTFDSTPAGMDVVYDGTSGATPWTQVTAVNSQHVLFTPSPQAHGGATFASWSDGGAQQHQITVPATNTTYRPTFNVAPVTARSVDFNGINRLRRDSGQPTAEHPGRLDRRGLVQGRERGRLQPRQRLHRHEG